MSFPDIGCLEFLVDVWSGFTDVKVHYAADEVTPPVVSPTEKIIIQEVSGTFLYYARTIDSMMLPALRTIAIQKSKPKENKMKKVKYFLYCIAYHPDTIITYHTPAMTLAVHSNDPTCQSQRLGGEQEDLCSVQPHGYPSQQRHHRGHCLSNCQSSDVICSRGQTWSPLHQLQRGGPSTPSAWNNGSQTASHTSADQQHGSTWCG